MENDEDISSKFSINPKRESTELEEWIELIETRVILTVSRLTGIENLIRGSNDYRVEAVRLLSESYFC